MYLSYSGYKLYIECQRAYYHRYIAKTQPAKPDNRVHMLYGDAVGKIFEKFYEDRLWKSSSVVSDLQALVEPTVRRIVNYESRRGGVFDWNEPKLKKGTRSLDEVKEEILETVPRGLRIIKSHRLLGKNAAAEVKLDVDLEGHRIGGRADFIMTRIKPHGDHVIVDGKGSRWRGKYASERQLRWYAMQHRIKFGTIPDKLAFLFWRFEPEESMDWFETSEKELDDLQHGVLTAISQIEASTQELVQLGRGAKPGPIFMANTGHQCKLCSYIEECPEGKSSLSDYAKEQREKDRESGVEDGGFSL